jgi:hypothetical protein
MSNQRDYARSRPGVVLFPAMRHHAAALSAHQALTDTLTFNVDAVFNKRWSQGGYATNTAGVGRSAMSMPIRPAVPAQSRLRSGCGLRMTGTCRFPGLRHGNGEALQCHLHGNRADVRLRAAIATAAVRSSLPPTVLCSDCPPGRSNWRSERAIAATAWFCSEARAWPATSMRRRTASMPTAKQACRWCPPCRASARSIASV